MAYKGTPKIDLPELESVTRLRESGRMKEHGVQGMKWGDHHQNAHDQLVSKGWKHTGTSPDGKTSNYSRTDPKTGITKATITTGKDGEQGGKGVIIRTFHPEKG